MDVLFVVMPFADASRPALGVSLLKREIAAHGFSSRIEYFNLELAALIGPELYAQIANRFPPETLIGDWFFADTVFRDGLPDEADYLAKVLGVHGLDLQLSRKIVDAREYRFQFIETCARRISELGPRVVGFTTTFHQTCACLAVARRLKELPDPPVIVFGGANCEGQMGLQMVRSFSWVDYACTGEGDRAFPELLQHLFRDGAMLPVGGIVTRNEDSPTFREPVKDLDSLPIPDYQDYFEKLDSANLRPELRVDLLIETSRGCWWGAKQHCTFCGLNGDTMNFRSKSPARVFSELRMLSETYGLKSIQSVDNILDMKYIPTLFELLRDSGLDLELFYEVKANLRYEQLRILRAGGMRAIQPGIESFSNQVLRLMRKGSTGLQNIQLLRWCEELDIRVYWNLLAGFPGESPSEYAHMAELLPLLTHLEPPLICSPIRLDRFSPFFFNAEDLGLTRLRPAPAYFYAFPLGRQELARLAYYFDFDYTDGRRPINYIARLIREVERWTEANRPAGHPAPQLDALSSDGEVTITDTRSVAVAPIHRLSGLAAEVYLQCDSLQSLTGLERQFRSREGANIHDILANLVNAKLMVADENHYLSLAVFRNRTAPLRSPKENGKTSLQKTEASYPLLHVV
jgi:ribosomal peptide maturation radical SAM protein 1